MCGNIIVVLCQTLRFSALIHHFLSKNYEDTKRFYLQKY
ncbi:hypothetical protein A1OE_1239 [Candidatus Endolissoclinum faulkneri L2]|uniref:Uncharacterized protein n=1 Tax=Candidatus Endolissoclinum faulkneri L2 TaxID=1193729 RepID=K7Z5R6_9PROT|nr:hypothetical protein A1OE_1239 [Candidatus Endolissoclinum faulkneri L2]